VTFLALWAMVKGAALSLLGLLRNVLVVRLHTPVWIFILMLGAGWWHGRTEHAQGYDAANARHQAHEAALVKRIAEARAKSAVVTERIVNRVEYRTRTIRERGATIVKEVPIYVPDDSCALPGGFRVLHDAAAAGVLPDPARIPLAAPVPAQVVAGTVAGNYATCQENDETYNGLLVWGCAHGWPVAPEVCASLEIPSKPGE
jgi:hypothetical protein